MVKVFLVAVPVLVVLAACGVERSSGEPAATATTTTTEETTTTTTATMTTTTTTAAPFVAADGTNLAACADGVCEVFVTTGNSLPSAVGPVQITVAADTVTLSQVDASGFASNMTGAPGSTQQINNQVFDIVAVQNGQAVVRLSLG